MRDKEVEIIEEGSATPAIVGVMSLLLLLGLLFSALGGVYVAKTRLQAQVDMAALGSAYKVPSSLVIGNDIACGSAEQILDLDEVNVASCHVREGDIWLIGTQKISVLGMPVAVQAKARAGPVGPYFK